MQILGIHIDRPFLRAALIEKKGRSAEILYLKSPILGEPENVKLLYTPAFKGKIVSALPARNLMARFLEVKIRNRSHLEKIVAFQSEATSYLNPADIQSVPYILRQEKEKAHVLQFTTLKESIREHIQELAKIKFDPDCVTAAPIALIRYLKWKVPNIRDAFLVDLSSEEWTCLCMENGELRKFISIPGGVERLFASLWEDRKKILFQKEVKAIAKQIDLLQLKPALNPHLFSTLNAMKQDFTKIIYSFCQQTGPKPIFFTGEQDAFGQMREFFMEGVKDSVSPEAPPEFPKEEQKYAIPIGLALGAQENPPQFRVGEFFPQKNWKKIGKQWILSVAASLMISCGLISFTNYAVETRKQNMLHSLEGLLTHWNPHLKKTIFLNSTPEEILHRWNKTVSSYSKESPYFKSYPKVAQTLSWLYQHPLVSQSPENESIEVSYFHYHLLQYPNMDSPKTSYKGKVELEFKTKSPLAARKFHEELLQGSAFVDTSQDVEWETTDDVYRVSFFLKEAGS